MFSKEQLEKSLADAKLALPEAQTDYEASRQTLAKLYDVINFATDALANYDTYSAPPADPDISLPDKSVIATAISARMEQEKAAMTQVVDQPIEKKVEG